MVINRILHALQEIWNKPPLFMLASVIVGVLMVLLLVVIIFAFAGEPSKRAE